MQHERESPEMPTRREKMGGKEVKVSEHHHGVYYGFVHVRTGRGGNGVLQGTQGDLMVDEGANLRALLYGVGYHSGNGDEAVQERGGRSSHLHQIGDKAWEDGGVGVYLGHFGIVEAYVWRVYRVDDILWRLGYSG